MRGTQHEKISKHRRSIYGRDGHSSSAKDRVYNGFEEIQMTFQCCHVNKYSPQNCQLNIS